MKLPVYFDNAATSPLDQRVLGAMLPFFKDDFGNASSIHQLGRIANVAVEEARESIAKLLNCKPAEIIFTSGGTESDNSALLGVMNGNTEKNELITSVGEHHAILHSADLVEHLGYTVHRLILNQNGTIDSETYKHVLSNRTALVSIMHINNEIGVVNDLKFLSDLAHKNGALFHTDAVQSVGKYPIDVKEMGIDLLSLSAHKLHGPKGIGVLYIKNGVNIKPFMLGGSQERNRRGGTLNVPGIIGLGKAAEIALEEMDVSQAHLKELKQRLLTSLDNQFGKSIILNGTNDERTAPHITNISFDFDEDEIDGEMLLLNLDIEGICCSNGSACTSGAVEPSHVLLEIGVEPKRAKSSLRISFGKQNRLDEVDFFMEKLQKVLSRMLKRSFSRN